MQIGVPREIKQGETRVSMTPNLCRRCTKLGAAVLVEKGAGLTAGFTDAEYLSAGARIAKTAAQVWRQSDLILKVKEPLPSEYPLMQSNQTLFTYLHLAAAGELATALLKKRILGIAYETVEAQDGTLRFSSRCHRSQEGSPSKLALISFSRKTAVQVCFWEAFPGQCLVTSLSSVRAIRGRMPAAWPSAWERK